MVKKRVFLSESSRDFSFENIIPVTQQFLKEKYDINLKEIDWYENSSIKTFSKNKKE